MFTQSWNMRFMSLLSKGPLSSCRRKSQILRVKKHSSFPGSVATTMADGFVMLGKPTGLWTRGAHQVCPALGHVFMPYSKLLLKKVEGQNRERAFSNAHKYFLLLAQITWRFASARVFRQALTVLGSCRWALSLSQGEHSPSVTMATTFLSLTTTVN